jgi:TolA-binding protein
MRKFLLLVFLMSLSGCVSTMSDQTQSDLARQLTAANALTAKQQEMIVNKERPDIVAALVDEAYIKMNDIYMICADKDKVPGYLISICMSYGERIHPIAAEMKLTAAGYYARTGNLDKAKELYRHIIVTYTGYSYLPVVRRAQFGLEDIREAEIKKQ